MNAYSPLPSVHVERSGDVTRLPHRALSVAFVLSDGFDALTLASAIAPMRAACHPAAPSPFQWRLYGASEAPLTSSDGWSTDLSGVGDEVMAADYIFMCGGLSPDRPSSDRLPDFLRQAWRRGKVVGAFYGGLFTLARSGILKGHRFTVHHHLAPAFITKWPELEPSSDLYTVDDRIITCAGGTAAADMMHAILHDRLGPHYRFDLMQAGLFAGIRSGNVPQSGSLSSWTGTRNATLLQAIRWMEAHFLEDDCLSRFDGVCDVSIRQLQRLFQKHLRVTPKAYITELRLKRAISLLSHTDLTINEIAAECGYDLTATFTKAFRDRFGVVPSKFSALTEHRAKAADDFMSNQKVPDSYMPGAAQ